MSNACGLFIDPDFAKRIPAAAVRDQLARILKSTDFSLCEDTGQVRLLGSRCDHLQGDPDLPTVCAETGFDQPDGGPGFHRSIGSVDFCLEDGLSGMFLARTMSKHPRDDWIILHLDDHRDMMSTLLAIAQDGHLHDPETGASFQTDRAHDWLTALARGTLTIGNYLVPLFHSKPVGSLTHIRHLHRNFDAHEGPVLLDVIAAQETFPVLGPIPFAAVEYERKAENRVGTFYHHTHPKPLLRDLPEGRVIVHIDLDFFVNDLRGNPASVPQKFEIAERSAVLIRMDAVFDHIDRLNRPVDRWVIATSPGFCAAQHWAWLMDALDVRICALTGEERCEFFG